MTNVSKPLIEALRGKRIDPPPIWLMRQAGRYLPEYRRIRESAGGFLNLCYNSEKATEVTLQPIRRFGLDAAILFSDILVVPHALGQHVTFEIGVGPKLKPIRDTKSLSALSLDGLHDGLGQVYATVEKVAQQLPDRVALIGFAGAPWTVATYMIEGGASRDFQNAKGWALANPDKFQSLIDLLTVATSAYLIRQADAGADAIQLFDTWAGVLPTYAFRRFCADPIREIARQVKKFHPNIPIIAFPKGVPLSLPDLVKTPEVDAIGIDYSIDPAWAARELQPHAVIQGNFDPTLLLAGGRELERGAKDIVHTFSKGPHIFNLGHGILPQTPVKHVEQLIATVRA
ncbi:MAG: uroporphyrinogen decarboxylase [Pseudomonadota bacterium]|nr:uroporphyrinogen decarboxylase [Pseudomonadota bacterium]